MVLAACGDNIPEPARGVTVVGNESATCALDASGQLFCWGRLHGNQIGVGELGDPATGLPMVRFPDFLWRTVSITAGHACGIRDDGSLWCWGRNCAAQLGDGKRESSAEPKQVGTQTSWISVTTGGCHSCAIDIDG
jgi:alpha-tubulin suppressor-like RCC1 family protein